VAGKIGETGKTGETGETGKRGESGETGETIDPRRTSEGFNIDASFVSYSPPELLMLVQMQPSPEEEGKYPSI